MKVIDDGAAGRRDERADVLAMIERCRLMVTKSVIGRPSVLMQGRLMALNELHGAVARGEHIGASKAKP